MNDLIDVMKTRLREGGFSDVMDSLSDGRRFPEAVVLAFGTPERTIADYAGTERETLRVTTLVERRDDPKAHADAVAAEQILHGADLESINGSYKLVSAETSSPAPLPRTESGRYIWAFDTIVTTERKDFF